MGQLPFGMVLANDACGSINGKIYYLHAYMASGVQAYLHKDNFFQGFQNIFFFQLIMRQFLHITIDLVRQFLVYSVSLLHLFTHQI